MEHKTETLVASLIMNGMKLIEKYEYLKIF
jgi:hypothetical protein